MIKMNIYIKDLIIKSAESNIKLQKKDGSFLQGHNGPWNDKDTPLRVTSHISILMIKAYKISKNKVFRDSAMKAALYITKNCNRPYGYSFYCRDGKNKCNGLIGQAWVIEALIELSIFFNKKKMIDIATEVILKHKFNIKKKLWHNLEIDGKILNINKTINQQIWFSFMVFKISKITKNASLKKNVDLFLKNLHKNISFNEKINHLVPGIHNMMFNKEAKGYLSFLLMGLAHFYNIDKKSLDNKIINYIKKSISFLNNKIYNSNTKYAWSYNPTGIEVAYIINTFSFNSKKTSKQWIEKQLTKNYDFDTNLLNKNTNDKNTLISRIYELTYLDKTNIVI
jgi:hypothetical protein